MDEFGLILIHIFEDIDSLSFLSQNLIDDISTYSYGNYDASERRRFLIAIERFSDNSLKVLQMFLENKKYFPNKISWKCNCSLCEVSVIDDIPCTLQRLNIEFPLAIKKIKELRDVVTKKDEGLYLRRMELSLTRMNHNIQDLNGNEYSSFYHENCANKQKNIE